MAVHNRARLPAWAQQYMAHLERENAALQEQVQRLEAVYSSPLTPVEYGARRVVVHLHGPAGGNLALYMPTAARVSWHLPQGDAAFGVQWALRRAASDPTTLEISTGVAGQLLVHPVSTNRIQLTLQSER
jgi:hypothetical protein